ncbi:hypothetical protein H4R34_005952, partial [Dimargaris verticillata]
SNCIVVAVEVVVAALGVVVVEVVVLGVVVGLTIMNNLFRKYQELPMIKGSLQSPQSLLGPRPPNNPASD